MNVVENDSQRERNCRDSSNCEWMRGGDYGVLYFSGYGSLILSFDSVHLHIGLLRGGVQ